MRLHMMHVMPKADPKRCLVLYPSRTIAFTLHMLKKTVIIVSSGVVPFKKASGYPNTTAMVIGRPKILQIFKYITKQSAKIPAATMVIPLYEHMNFQRFNRLVSSTYRTHTF